MRVSIVLEHRFYRTPNGSIWTQTMFDYSFWTAYLEVFDQVQVVARVREILSQQPYLIRASGDEVTFAAVPYYLGPWQYALKSKEIKRVMKGAIRQPDAVIFQLSSTLANCIEPHLFKILYPYGVEVVDDPYDVFSPGALKHPLRPFFRWYYTQCQKRLCSRAVAVSYVTERALQRRYPPGPGIFSTSYSFNIMHDKDFALTPRQFASIKHPIKIITVGSMAHLYKAQDILIKAMALCVAKGFDLQLILVGDGRYRSLLERQVAELGLSKSIGFVGQITFGSKYLDKLDKADLFVLPSRQEGLPRAMVEAMARGLPCIGSTVGGIPELLPSEDLVPPDDAPALARKIMEVVGDKERLTRMSCRNWEKAKEYHNDALQARRVEFYDKVKQITQEWLAQKSR